MPRIGRTARPAAGTQWERAEGARARAGECRCRRAPAQTLGMRRARRAARSAPIVSAAREPGVCQALLSRACGGGGSEKAVAARLYARTQAPNRLCRCAAGASFGRLSCGAVAAAAATSPIWRSSGGHDGRGGPDLPRAEEPAVVRDARGIASLPCRVQQKRGGFMGCMGQLRSADSGSKPQREDRGA